MDESGPTDATGTGAEVDDDLAGAGQGLEVIWRSPLQSPEFFPTNYATLATNAGITGVEDIIVVRSDGVGAATGLETLVVHIFDGNTGIERLPPVPGSTRMWNENVSVLVDHRQEIWLYHVLQGLPRLVHLAADATEKKKLATPGMSALVQDGEQALVSFVGDSPMLAEVTEAGEFVETQALPAELEHVFGFSSADAQGRFWVRHGARKLALVQRDVGLLWSVEVMAGAPLAEITGVVRIPGRIFVVGSMKEDPSTPDFDGPSFLEWFDEEGMSLGRYAGEDLDLEGDPLWLEGAVIDAKDGVWTHGYARDGRARDRAVIIRWGVHGERLSVHSYGSTDENLQIAKLRPLRDGSFAAGLVRIGLPPPTGMGTPPRKLELVRVRLLD